MLTEDIIREEFCTIKEMCGLTGRSPKTIRRYIENKLFTNVIKTPSSFLIHKDEIHKIYQHLNPEPVD